MSSLVRRGVILHKAGEGECVWGRVKHGAECTELLREEIGLVKIRIDRNAEVSDKILTFIWLRWRGADLPRRLRYNDAQ